MNHANVGRDVDYKMEHDLKKDVVMFVYSKNIHSNEFVIHVSAGENFYLENIRSSLGVYQEFTKTLKNTTKGMWFQFLYDKEAIKFLSLINRDHKIY